MAIEKDDGVFARRKAWQKYWRALPQYDSSTEIQTKKYSGRNMNG